MKIYIINKTIVLPQPTESSKFVMLKEVQVIVWFRVQFEKNMHELTSEFSFTRDIQRQNRRKCSAQEYTRNIAVLS